ncbi:MAG TPA: cation:proton antiporter subunit C, partial [Coriobacteriia bacterium]|nr:cation:proton antiporter subunit C [Coriobacteriia bacterium]
MIAALWQNLDYAASVALFCIGLYAVITKENLIKKFMGLNIMETAVFAFILALGVVDGGEAPIMGPGVEAPFINPIPQALILSEQDARALLPRRPER